MPLNKETKPNQINSIELKSSVEHILLLFLNKIVLFQAIQFSISSFFVYTLLNVQIVLSQII